MSVSIVPKGLAFGRYCKSLLVARGDVVAASAFADGQAWRDTPQVAFALKAAIAPLDTVDSESAAPLSMYPVLSDFAELLRPASLIGRMQGLRRAPFGVKMLSSSAGASASWIGQGNPVPVSALSFDTDVLGWFKIGSMTVHTTELARSAAPGVEGVIAADVARAAGFCADLALVDPTNAGVAGIRPQSITYGISPIPSSGAAVANVDTDIRAALAVLNDADIDLATCYWIMAPHTAVYLSLLRGDGGAAAYAGMTAKGGTLGGIPVLTTHAIGADPDSPAETYIVLCSADSIDVADDGAAVVEVSENAAIQMTDSPDADGGPEQLVSMFQNNMIALRATRTINWKLRRPGSVALIDGIQY